jgi:hypothetical protein
MVRSEGNMSLKNPVTPTGIDPGTVRLVAQRLNHYATPSPVRKYMQELLPGSLKCKVGLKTVGPFSLCVCVWGGGGDQ